MSTEVLAPGMILAGLRPLLQLLLDRRVACVRRHGLGDGISTAFQGELVAGETPP